MGRYIAISSSREKTSAGLDESCIMSVRASKVMKTKRTVPSQYTAATNFLQSTTGMLLNIGGEKEGENDHSLTTYRTGDECEFEN